MNRVLVLSSGVGDFETGVKAGGAFVVEVDDPFNGVLIDALSLPFSLRWQSQWTAQDRDGRTAVAIAQVVNALGLVLEHRPAWWTVVGTQGRLPSLVPQIGQQPDRRWFSPLEFGCGWRPRIGVWGRFKSDDLIKPARAGVEVLEPFIAALVERQLR